MGLIHCLFCSFFLKLKLTCTIKCLFPGGPLPVPVHLHSFQPNLLALLPCAHTCFQQQLKTGIYVKFLMIYGCTNNPCAHTLKLKTKIDLI